MQGHRAQPPGCFTRAAQCYREAQQRQPEVFRVAALSPVKRRRKHRNAKKKKARENAGSGIFTPSARVRHFERLCHTGGVAKMNLIYQSAANGGICPGPDGYFDRAVGCGVVDRKYERP